MPLRLVFFGTPELARVSLAALLSDPLLDVVAVVCQPDRPSGRSMRVQPCPVKVEALAHERAVLQPERARDPKLLEALTAFQPDVIVVAAYGQILPQAILDLPKFGCVNVHASLLPKYRGAAPIQWALVNGDAETGVTLMKMDAGLDTGAIISQEPVGILESDTGKTLHDRVAVAGAGLLIRTLPAYVSGQITPRPQPQEGVSYARKISKSDGQLDWTQPARSLWLRVRAFNPWPGAFTHLPGSASQPLLKILEAQLETEARGEPGEILAASKQGVLVACGEGALNVLRLQREGARAMTAQEFLAGMPLAPGTHLGGAS